MQLLYFDVDQKTLADHALRRSIISATFWACAHYLLFVCTAITGSGVAMACAVAGDAGDFPEPERRRWYDPPLPHACVRHCIRCPHDTHCAL